MIKIIWYCHHCYHCYLCYHTRYQPATPLYFLHAACLLYESPGWSNIQYQILTVFSLPTVSPNILTKLVPYPRVISDIIQNWTMPASGVTHTAWKGLGLTKKFRISNWSELTTFSLQIFTSDWRGLFRRLSLYQPTSNSHKQTVK